MLKFVSYPQTCVSDYSLLNSVVRTEEICVEYRIVFKYDNDIVLHESICSIWRIFICKIYALDNKLRHNGIGLFQMEVISW